MSLRIWEVVPAVQHLERGRQAETILRLCLDSALVKQPGFHSAFTQSDADCIRAANASSNFTNVNTQQAKAVTRLSLIYLLFAYDDNSLLEEGREYLSTLNDNMLAVLYQIVAPHTCAQISLLLVIARRIIANGTQCEIFSHLASETVLLDVVFTQALNANANNIIAYLVETANSERVERYLTLTILLVKEDVLPLLVTRYLEVSSGSEIEIRSRLVESLAYGYQSDRDNTTRVRMLLSLGAHPRIDLRSYERVLFLSELDFFAEFVIQSNAVYYWPKQDMFTMVHKQIISSIIDDQV